MNRDDVIKFIDGKIFYYSDYINFLYEQLQLRDEIIKEARELLKATEIENSWFKQFKKKQLEILDKVEENK